MTDQSPTKPGAALIGEIEVWLKRFSWVMWDRCSGDLDDIDVFGWIERKDAYKDFLVINFVEGQPERFSTSSAEYSKIIADYLGFSHDDCMRVENVFNIKNAIKLPQRISKTDSQTEGSQNATKHHRKDT